MPEAAKELAILFADICDSTELYERLGDAEARAMIDAWMSDSAQAVAAHGGRLVKSLGDGILSTFPSAESALAAALSMQEQKRTQVRIRAGFHLGPVIESGGDIFGDAVNVAARVAALAKEDEILFTESSVRALPPEARLGTRFLDKAMVKGKKEPVAIYGLVSDAVDNTVMMQAAESSSSGGLHHDRIVDGVGDQPVNRNGLFLSLHHGLVQKPGAQASFGRKGANRALGEEDLVHLGQGRDPGGDVDRVAEDVAPALDHRAHVAARADPDLRPLLLLHRKRRRQRGFGAREGTQDPIAQGLHHPTALRRHGLCRPAHPGIDHRPCLVVAQALVELGAVADVDEEYGQFLGRLRHQAPPC